MKRLIVLFISMLIAAVSMGCGSYDIPQAHKGQLFDMTGVWAFYAGGKGLTGDILGPGTVYTGVYNEIRMVNCSQKTVKEPLTALTKDNVQFSLDIYVMFSANCVDEKAVKWILSTLSPVAPTKDPADGTEANQKITISNQQLYDTYIRAALGEAVRVEVSPYIANDVNEKREKIFSDIKVKFEEMVKKYNPSPIIISSINLSNLHFPDAMVQASTERAVQAVLKDKAIAEREKVTAEIETTDLKKKLAQSQVNNEAVWVETMGAALRKYPEYLQYDMQSKMSEIYQHAGEKGNMIIAAPNVPIVLPTKK
jgi:regulator of protease activity HflC (stomatin/prohibitin superfamily)